MTAPVPAAVWLRVSTDDQTSDNQVPDVQRFVAHHGYEVTKRYEVSDSAWKQGPEYRAAIARALADAHKGHFRVLVVWALDRLVRAGSEPGKTASEEALSLFRKFGQEHVAIVSIQEPWLSSEGLEGVLIPFAAWLAEQESKRKSDRIRAGIARRRAEGGHVGRKPGSRDKKPRTRRAATAA